MYKITDISGYTHKKLYSFKDAIRTLKEDMYISWHDIELASITDSYKFTYGFTESFIERVEKC